MVSAVDHLGVQFHHTDLPGDYHRVTARIGHDEIGWLQHKGGTSSEHHTAGEISALGVAESYQHQGVATAMYHEAAKVSPVPVHSSPVRTKAGEGWGVKAGVPRVPLRDEGYLADMEPPPIKYVRD